jgi:glycosyltransferase involved in cell wall biosynthesis
MINVPLRVPTDPKRWITVPPQGYGGIQWVVTNLIDGLLELGHTVYLLGAPGSRTTNRRLIVVDAAEPHEISNWLSTHTVDLVHDHSNGIIPLSESVTPFISTHHLTGRPRFPQCAVYLSYAHRADGESQRAPVIRIPVNPARYRCSASKSDYLLVLSRVSRWKGVLEAAEFASAAGAPLWIAGPAWEQDYLELILREHSSVVSYLGEVGDEHRLDLLARARAVLALSQPYPGPWNRRWSEPGATVISEAAASGTPAISSDNGCLSEITPLVGRVIPVGARITPRRAGAVLRDLPAPAAVRATAVQEWGHIKIAAEYVDVYRERLRGATWD